jgi:hypothetical protein
VIQSIEPTQLFAGDLAQWTLGPNESIQVGTGNQFDLLFSGPGIMRDYLVGGTGLMQDYPPSAWAMHYVLKNKDQSFSFDATDDGQGSYVISADSSTWAPGKYILIGWVTAKTGSPPARHVVRTAMIQVFQNPAGDGPIDFRTPARQIYEQILSDESRGVQTAEYTIGARHIRYTDAKERDYLRRVWAHKVAREEGKLAEFDGVTFSL